MLQHSLEGTCVVPSEGVVGELVVGQVVKSGL